jgi:hypothetical protein
MECEFREKFKKWVPLCIFTGERDLWLPYR